MAKRLISPLWGTKYEANLNKPAEGWGGWEAPWKKQTESYGYGAVPAGYWGSTPWSQQQGGYGYGEDPNKAAIQRRFAEAGEQARSRIAAVQPGNIAAIQGSIADLATREQEALSASETRWRQQAFENWARIMNLFAQLGGGGQGDMESRYMGGMALA